MVFLRETRRSLIALAACLPLTAAGGRSATPQSPVATADASDATPLQRRIPTIGMNLESADLTYYGTAFPFIDRMRTSPGWSAKDLNFDNLPQGTVVMNPKTHLPAGQASNISQVSTVIGLDPAPLPGPDRYVITWEGAGVVRMGYKLASNEKAGDHRYTFDYTGTDVTANVVVTKLDDRDPIRNLHLVRADQLDRFAAGQVFSPEFLTRVAQWSVIRFMDWGRTNGSTIVDWSQMPSDASIWQETGAPIETMVALANAAKTDMWYCIPAHANDVFVRQALTYVRDHLEPSLTLHLEYSNEVWNGAFEQFHYAQAQGAALGQRLKLTKPIGTMEWYGYRSAQIAKLTDEVYGTSSRRRVKNVVGTQTAWLGLEDAIWDGVKLSRLGTPASLFEEYAVTTYFGHSIGGGSDADKAKVLGWARQGPAGLDAVFSELSTGGQLSDDSSLDNLKKPLAYHARVAKRLGLDLVAYEGGHHLTALGYANKDQDDVVAFIGRIVNDPRMGRLYTQMIDEFGAVGGKTLVAFNDVGGVTKFGAWGVSDTIYQEHSPRYDALVAAQRRATQKP
ncbi:hypothetical protein GGQ80_000914 [Sphingomonas jinjuensis]|uniref:Cellulose-binding domain protein n=1 Tax=Sphingomonas jinjuensis TaxID=535907 RepID=A0A840F9Q7_9SPHN|nr:hypothetical protein [Sphingomonas jinjuensis]MBB4153026.1 hypothetical protein [Sphingomonas jinjuensis]